MIKLLFVISSKHGALKTAMGVVFLATKVEECPRRVRDIINVFDRLDRIRTNEEPIGQGVELFSDVRGSSILRRCGFN
jgi:hypothetical protein